LRSPLTAVVCVCPLVVGQVKQILGESRGIAVDDQVVLFAGMVLEDGNMLSDYKSIKGQIYSMLPNGIAYTILLIPKKLPQKNPNMGGLLLRGGTSWDDDAAGRLWCQKLPQRATRW
jgi:hypothetical protein